MRVARTAIASLIAGGLALSLVAAETEPVMTSSGTAVTRLLGAQIQVTGPLETPIARILDVATSATTEGTPRAVTSVVPIALSDGTRFGETGASSDGDTSGNSDGGDYSAPGGVLGIDVSPIETTATATADTALATVGAATSQVSDLLASLGLDLGLETAGVTSLVSPDGAAATQGMQFSGLNVDLGSLGLSADLLGQLGLENILALLESLPGLLPADVADLSALFGDLDALDGALADLDAAAAPLLDTLGQLALIEAALPDIVALDDLLTTLEGLGDPVTLLADLTAIADDLTAVGCGVDLASLDLLGELAAAITCVTDALDGIRTDLIAGGVDGLDGVAPEDLLAVVQTLQATLEGLLPGQLDAVTGLLDTVTGLVEQIVAALGDLEGLLGDLPDLLDLAAATDLLDIGAFDVGTSAIAGDTLDESSATILCDAVDVTVLGEAFATPDCSEALSGLTDVTGLITGAVGELSGVLNTLPLGEVVQVGEMRADLYTDVVEEVTLTDGVITSTAGFNLLDLAIPTLTLDPAQITSVLDGLALPGGLAELDGLLADLEGQLGVLDGLGLDVTELTSALDAANTLDVGALDALVGTVLGLADDLGIGTLLEEVSTPGLELLIDPISTATFQAAASGGTGSPAPTPTDPTPPAPAPAPAPAPTLPSTGGGLALLGVLALAGAGTLRRRR